ncbi:hypothetical protein AC812_07295 [Bellilinea caldifistulae]|uniref:Membrane protein 6-pyruvoyl-tetrahydropterin synthase-related domain-containing protein n=1 Tax=Bellilinea caldifistulae TaxID=360411 RepID=A0A0P6X7Z0_9CHLR|nr:hypothetical protein AC812_07295 [Bellilinea caldifistulae]
MGIAPAAAIFSSAVWMGTSKLIGYVGGGQVSSVYAICWLPWLLCSLRFAAERFSDYRRVLLSSAVLSTIVLIDIRWGFLCGLIGLAFLLGYLPYRKLSISKVFRGLFLLGFGTVLLTSSLIFPLIEFMPQSDRAVLSTSERAILSLNVHNLIGAITPQLGIIYELITYIGLVAVVLAFFGVKKQNWFWLSLILFGVLFSLGNHSFLFPFISELLPGLGWLRVPSRMWFFVVFAVVVLAGYGLNHLLTVAIPQSISKITLRLSIFFSLFSVILAGGVAVLYPPLPGGLLVFAVILPIALILINLLIHKPRISCVMAIVSLAVIDLLWVNTSFLRSVPLEPSPPVVRWLENQPALFRVYSPSYSIPLPHQLQTAEGVNPLRLKSYSQFMAEASRIPAEGYSVSVPSIYLDEKSPPELFQVASSPDLEKLGLLNVKYIVSNFPMNISSQIDGDFGNVYVYLNPLYRERVWLSQQGSVVVRYWSPDLIIAEVDSRTDQMVVFSEVYYPGWRAKVNGQSVSVEVVDGLLRGIKISPGRHTIEMRFRPLSFYSGLGLSLFSWLILLYIGRDYVRSLVAKDRSFISRTGNL